MYKELIEALRLCVKYGKAEDALANASQAADAIEELQKVANKLLVEYQEEAETVIWEYSGHIDESMDYLHEEIKGLKAQIDGKQEPLKEETE